MKFNHKFIVDILFVLTLFVIFTVSGLFLVTVGASVYKTTVENMTNNYDSRTSIAYITEKIRQNDCISSYDGINLNDNLIITNLKGVNALKLTQDINGKAYNTFLYFYDGYLKELFIEDNAYLGDDYLNAGQNIIKLTDFTFEELSQNLYLIKITNLNGKVETIYITTRSNKS